MRNKPPNTTTITRTTSVVSNVCTNGLALNQLSDCPNVIRDSAFHCGSHAQRFMNAAEIVMREVECKSRLQVVPFFRERIRQSSKPTHHHAHCQILPFNIRRVDVLRIGASRDRLRDRFKVHGRDCTALASFRRKSTS